MMKFADSLYKAKMLKRAALGTNVHCGQEVGWVPHILRGGETTLGQVSIMPQEPLETLVERRKQSSLPTQG